MQNKSYISTLEQKLLVGFFVFISLLFYFHFVGTKIENYNEKVRIEQSDLTYKANIPPERRIDFAVDVGYPPMFSQIFWIQFLLIPLLLFLIWKRNFDLFLFSFVLNILPTASLIYWNYYNFDSYRLNEIYWLHNSPYGYFGLFSHLTGFILAIASTIFVIIQLAIITRFVFEKNQVKISLR